MNLLFIKLLNIIFGYVIIDIFDGFPERFVNLISNSNINTWGIARTKNNRIRLRIRCSQFEKLRHIAFVTKVKVKIVKKCGLPFLIYRYRKRYGLVIGAVLFLVLLFLPTFFVWDIEVTGVDSQTAQQIEETIYSDGIKIGAPTFSLDRRIAQLHILEEHKEIVWSKISVNGSRVTVATATGTQIPDMIDENKACNIVASKDGVITSIDVLTGTKIVNKGDTVLKGELLVSGVVDAKNDGVKYVHSLAQVKADTLTVISAQMPLKYITQAATGNKYTRYSLIILDKLLPLYIKDEVKYSFYDSFEDRKFLSFSDKFYFPLGIKKEQIYQTQQEEIIFTKEEAEKAALELLLQKEKLALNGIEIKDRQVQVVIENDVVIATGTYLCSEQIGLKVEID